MWPRSIHYERQELLGEGGQGCVYKALRRDRTTGLSQVVALKILHSKTAVAQWRQEFESLSRVRSQYCVRALAFERIGRRPALVLEYIDGVSLARLGQTCLLEREDIEEIGAQLELALKDLHGHGICHGDLSPHNILIDRAGHLRLLDFGLANSAPGPLRLTPEFSAPERLQGAPVSVATDLYALGRVLDFLRGQPVADSPYLHGDPQARHFLNPPTDRTRQDRLGAKVNAYLERVQTTRALQTRTQTQHQARPTRTPLASCLAVLFLLTSLAVSGASQVPKPAVIALLVVHTEKWHSFQLDGQSVGYAPFSLPVRAAQRYRLEWTSASGRGTREIALKPDETLVLGDRDFSH